MEKKEKINRFIQAFSFVMQNTIQTDFDIPRNKRTDYIIGRCVDMLDKHFTEFSLNRIVNYCVCQIHAYSNFSEENAKHWRYENAFGKTAVKRFINLSEGQKFYEDRWLKSYRLSRNKILSEIKAQSENPYKDYIYLEHEEYFKRRAHNKEAGFFICQSLTLLWSPFSKACTTCHWEKRCQEVTKEKYPRIYTARVNELLIRAEHEKQKKRAE